MLRVEAFAKINRELRVGAVRSDGFHEIHSRFASIDLADELMAEPSLGRLAFSCDDVSIPQDERNLVVKAARVLASRLGTAAGARLRLIKRIPAGAGLGGGSADAAAALVLLGRLWEAGLTVAELSNMAESLGSDVPFFLTGGEADVTGRGETVAPLPDEPAAELLVAAPAFEIATSQVFAAHRRRHEGRGALPERLEIEISGRFFGPNDLEPAIVEVRPEMAELLDTARGASKEATVTGSGSAIVLLRPSEDAVRLLAGVTPGCRFLRTRTLTREEYRRRALPLG